MKTTNLPLHLTSLVAFLIPAFALWIRTGPSYGAALLLLGTLCFMLRWIKIRPTSGTWALAIALLSMAVLWFELTTQQGFHRWDRPIKWALGALCIFFAAAYPPRPNAFFYGLPVGCIGMGALAFWQVFGQGMGRATGYTSAIPWGDTALVLACFSGVYTAVFWKEKSWSWRLLQIFSVIAGLSASLLSQARGGWIALAPVLLMFLLIGWQMRSHLFRPLAALLCGLLMVFLLIIGITPSLRAHVEKAVTEVSQFYQDHKVGTSLGIRLEQYRLALEVIPEKPLLGWSRKGFVAETERRVALGDFDPSIIEFKDFIHNEILDSWAKTGIPGVLIQLAIYAVPIFLFWPSRKRLSHLKIQEEWQQALCLRLMGCLMGVMYLSFGMTMPYFAHNSGTVFFIFCLICLWSALQSLDRKPNDQVMNP